MEADLAILAPGARGIGRASEIDGVLRHECPVAIDNDGQQLPVLRTALADPADVCTFVMTPVTGEFCKFLAEALVDQQLHARRRLATFLSETTFSPDPGMRGRRGRPRGGVASA